MEILSIVRAQIQYEYLCSMQLYGGVRLPEAACAHLPNLTQISLG